MPSAREVASMAAMREMKSSASATVVSVDDELAALKRKMTEGKK